MTQTLYILGALAVGLGSAVQVAFISQMGRLRGATEATWINTLGALAGVSLAILFESLRNNQPNLPAPFNHAAVFAGAAALSAVCIAVSMRGLNPYLAISGLFGFLYVFGAGFLAPRLGIALFAATVTAATLAGSVVLDHYGAFGAAMHKATLIRVLGVAALFAGVVMVRSGR